MVKWLVRLFHYMLGRVEVSNDGEEDCNVPQYRSTKAGIDWLSYKGTGLINMTECLSGGYSKGRGCVYQVFELN